MPNPLPVAPAVRQPRGALLVGGQVTPFVSWEINQTMRFQAGTFSALVPVKSLPKDYDLSWLDKQTSVDVEVRAGFPKDPDNFTPDQLTPHFKGTLDKARWDAGRNAISISGRDVIAGFIDTRTSEKFVNQTSSQIVTQIALKHGVTIIYTPTKTKVGAYYQIDQARSQNQRTEWDLICWLARQEDYVAFSDGAGFYFRPRPVASDPFYEFRYTAGSADNPVPSGNFTSLQVDRNFQLARDIKVTVQSFNYRTNKSFTKVAPAKPAEKALEYLYVRHGLTPQQTSDLAFQQYNELSRHEVRLEIGGPADETLTLINVLKLTGTPFDQAFFIDEVTRTMSADGYAWRITARNKSGDAAIDADTTGPQP